MKRWIVFAFALCVLPASAQDTLSVERDLTALRDRGIQAELRSKTAKRNPETGRSTLDMVEAYTKGVVADADGRIVLFLTEDGDEAWIRTNSLALLESAEPLVAILEAEGRDVSTLRELNDKWFPAEMADSPEAVRLAWEQDLASQGVPVTLTMFQYEMRGEGGMHPTFGLKNISQKTVTSLSIELLGFSERGDVIRDRSTDMATHYATLEGTLRPGDSALYSYDDLPLWVNRSTACVEVRKITATFQDGSTRSVDFQLANARLSEETYHTMGECSRVGSGP